jgi:hypothetical protein
MTSASVLENRLTQEERDNVPCLGCGVEETVITLCLYAQAAAEKAFARGHFDNTLTYPTTATRPSAELYAGALCNTSTLDMRWSVVVVGDTYMLVPE